MPWSITCVTTKLSTISTFTVIVPCLENLIAFESKLSKTCSTLRSSLFNVILSSVISDCISSSFLDACGNKKSIVFSSIFK